MMPKGENSGAGNSGSDDGGGGGAGTKMGGGGGGPTPGGGGGSDRGRGSGGSREPPKKPSKPKEKMFESEPITESTLDSTAPLPAYPEDKLHPPDSMWYKATITFEVELVSQPRPEETALLSQEKAGKS